MYHSNKQHSREWNVEIDGIPSNVGDDPDQLKEAVYELCHSLNVDIEEYEIETAHRLQSKVSPKPVIVRFFTRDTTIPTHEQEKTEGFA